MLQELLWEESTLLIFFSVQFHHQQHNTACKMIRSVIKEANGRFMCINRIRMRAKYVMSGK